MNVPGLPDFIDELPMLPVDHEMDPDNHFKSFRII